MILLVTPAPPDGPHGNGVTARRWAGILRDLGHEVVVAQDYRAGRYGALIALHARKSASAVRRFHASHPDAPVVIAMTASKWLSLYTRGRSRTHPCSPRPSSGFPPRRRSALRTSARPRTAPSPPGWPRSRPATPATRGLARVPARRRSACWPAA